MSPVTRSPPGDRPPPAAPFLRGSFRPPDEVCAVRSLLRHRDSLVKTASRSVLHMQKAFDQMNVHLHHAISDLTGLSGLAITDAILDGERDPARLAELAHPRTKASRATLIKALEGDWRSEHLFTLRHARRTYAHYQTAHQQVRSGDRGPHPRVRADAGAARRDRYRPATAAVPQTRPEPPAATGQPRTMQAHLTRLFGTDLTLIPGIGSATALVLFSELGPDLTRFRPPHSSRPG